MLESALESAPSSAFSGQERSLAQRRYQRGWLEADGKGGYYARWREDVIDPETGAVKRLKPRRHIGTFKTERLALRELERVLAEVDVNNPNYRPRRDSSFRKFAEKWMAEVLIHAKASTQAGDRSRIKKHILPCFEKFAVRDITAYEISHFIAVVKLGPKSKRNLVATLRMMHTTAEAWGLTDKDWFKGLKLPHRPKLDLPAFNVEQMRQIIEVSEEPFKTFYWITAEAGDRLGEGCALRPCDINLEGRTVTIQYSAWHGIVDSPKSGSSRRFSISHALAEHLRDFLKDMAPTAYIFHRKDGSPWVGDYDVVACHLRPLLIKLGIYRKGMGLHAFRRGNASMMDQIGTPMKVRMERIGHHDEEMTLHYTHAQSEDHKRVADSLGELLRPGTQQVIEWPEPRTERTQ
jgi:integrase